MELFAPSYYRKFKCISDRCRHSCCIDWEIDIDEKTLEKYQKIGNSICKNIDSSVDGAYIKLDEDGRCPFLDERGLCKIIIDYGEDKLSDICREHPRYYNDLGTSVEVGVGIVCEEACRLICSDSSEFSLESLGDIDWDCEEKDFSAKIDRDAIISIIDDEKFTLDEKISIIERKYKVSANIHSMEEWLDIYLNLDMLDGEWKEILTKVKDKKYVALDMKFNIKLERLLKYFVFRHVSIADDYSNLQARLGFSLLSILLLKYLAEREDRLNEERFLELARLYSSEIEYSEENTAELIFEFESIV